jgi:hypothetical protein
MGMGGFPGEIGTKTTAGGLVQVCAIVSLLTEKCSPPMTTMTGKVCRKDNPPFPAHARSDMSDVCLRITLRGRVSLISGIKEKVLGAHPAGANR